MHFEGDNIEEGAYAMWPSPILVFQYYNKPFLSGVELLIHF